MSSLKDQEEMQKKIASLIDSVSAVFKSVALDAKLAYFGEAGYKEAKAFLSTTTINPNLGDILNKIVPPGSPDATQPSIEFLKEDPLWVAVVARLLDEPFDKPGMSVYFIRYLQTIVRLNEFMASEKQFEKVSAGMDDLAGSLIKIGLVTKLKEQELLIMVLFGNLERIATFIPSKPSGLQDKLTVQLWKMAHGAMEQDYARVREVAKDFLAKSVSNTRLYQLANS